MEKNIKDYLHLYLGCECIMTRPSYHAVHELGLSGDRTFLLGGKFLTYFIEPTTKAEVKPILRPLSDLTHQEVWVFCNFNEYQKLIKYKVHESFLEINWDENEEKDRYYHYYFRQLSARQFHFLLSKHFDVFELIESGLAIDSTKQLAK